MMIKIATAAAALSLIVGASPAFALFPHYPVTGNAIENFLTESVYVYRQVEPVPTDDWTLDLGWESLGVMPPVAQFSEAAPTEFDGLSFSEELLDDEEIVVESEADIMI